MIIYKYFFNLHICTFEKTRKLKHLLCGNTLVNGKVKKQETLNKNCHSKYLIYLIECTLCNIPCVGKGDTPFNIHLNNHRSDVSDYNAIPGCRHFTRVTITLATTLNSH